MPARVTRRDRPFTSTYQMRFSEIGVIYWKMRDLLRKSPLRHVRLLQRLHWRVMAYATPPAASHGQCRFYLDPTDANHLSRTTEMCLPLRFLVKAIRPGDRVIDIGAHIGYYTINMARRVGVEGHVFAFEPDPTNFELLVQNLDANRCRNVTPLNLAVSDESGRATLYRSRCTALSRLHPSTLCDGAVEVETVRLDDYFGNVSDLSLIKMDVEGSELRVLNGMRNLPAASSLRIFTEFGPRWLSEGGCNPEEMIDLLRQFGFRLFQLDASESTPAEVLDDEAFLAEFSANSERVTDLWCLRAP